MLCSRYTEIFKPPQLNIVGKIKLILILGFILLLAACASVPTAVDLSRLESRQIEQVNVTAQNEVQINIHNLNPVIVGSLAEVLVGIAVGVAIDAARAKNARNAAAEIKENTADFDLQSLLKEAIPSKFNGPTFDRDLTVNVLNNNELQDESLNISGAYQLSDDFSHVKLVLIATLHGLGEAPAVRNYSSISTITGATFGQRKDNVDVLVLDNSAQLKTIVIRAVDEMLGVINNDFAGYYEYDEEAQKVMFSDGTERYTGRFLEEQNGNVIVGFNRNKQTSIFSISKELAIFK